MMMIVIMTIMMLSYLSTLYKYKSQPNRKPWVWLHGASVHYNEVLELKRWRLCSPPSVTKPKAECGNTEILCWMQIWVCSCASSWSESQTLAEGGSASSGSSTFIQKLSVMSLHWFQLGSELMTVNPMSLLA